MRNSINQNRGFNRNSLNDILRSHKSNRLSLLRKQRKKKEMEISGSIWKRWMDGYLLGHLDDDVGIAATDVTNGEINAASDADSEKTEQILHERGCRL